MLFKNYIFSASGWEVSLGFPASNSAVISKLVSALSSRVRVVPGSTSNLFEYLEHMSNFGSYRVFQTNIGISSRVIQSDPKYTQGRGDKIHELIARHRNGMSFWFSKPYMTQNSTQIANM